MPSFIKCVQWWLFLSKLWLVVCSQVNGISHCGSSLLCSAFLDWPPTSLCNINFCVENILVLFTEASSTTRHSTSLLWLSQVSSPSSITVIYMPRSWKPVLFENNWPMSSRWSSQPVFVTPYHCPTHPRLTLNGYQTHLTPKPSTDFVKTLPKHVSGEVIASSLPLCPVSATGESGIGGLMRAWAQWLGRPLVCISQHMYSCRWASILLSQRSRMKPLMLTMTALYGHLWNVAVYGI